jgi:ribosome-binding factor A
MKEFARTERVAAALQRELAQVLREEVRDPRLRLITLQEVRVSRDLAHAKVFFTCFADGGGAGEQERLLNGRLAGFLRRELAHRTRMRAMPQLHFVHDESIARAEHLSDLIESAVTPEPTESEGK